MRHLIFPASALLLGAAVVLYGIGLVVGAFDNALLALGAGLLTIAGLALTAYGARQQRR